MYVLISEKEVAEVAVVVVAVVLVVGVAEAEAADVWHAGCCWCLLFLNCLDGK
jgi:hypothetical protein